MSIYTGIGNAPTQSGLPPGGAPGDVLVLGPGGQPAWEAPSGGGGESLTLQHDGLGTVPQPGLWVVNKTPATSGAQQISPSVVVSGQGFNLESSVSDQFSGRLVCLPIAGPTGPPGGTVSIESKTGSDVGGSGWSRFISGVQPATGGRYVAIGIQGVRLLDSGSTQFHIIKGDGAVIGLNLSFAANTATAIFSDVLSFGNGKTLLQSEATNVLQLGSDSTSPASQLFKGCDRITSDGAGGDLIIAGGRNRGAFAGGSLIFQTSPAAGAGVTGTLAARLTIDGNGLATFAGAVATGTPAGGTAGQWKFGIAATVTPTAPNRTIQLDIGGTIYYLHAKTTNN